MPQWFIHFLNLPEFGDSFPITIEERRMGDIVFAPDLSADIFEKWVGFLAIVGSAIVLMLLTGAVAYTTAGSTLGSLQALSAGLTPDAAGPLRPTHSAVRAAGNPPEQRGSQ